MELTIEQKTDIGFEYVLDLVEPCSCFGAAKLKNTSVFSSKESLSREFDNIEKILKVLDERVKAIQVIDICFMQMKDISKTVENNSSHVFRHSKATYLLNTVKEDVVTVKEVLRHSSIDSTLIYLNPKEEAINKVRINNDI